MVKIKHSYGGGGILNTLINKLPFELHIPGYQFCGPGTRLKERLARGDEGINLLDTACREHDIAYSENKNIEKRHIADKILAKAAKKRIIAKDAKLGERAAATATWAAMTVKRKLGMGIRKKSQTKRKLRVAKRGGILPLLPILGVLGSLVGGAASVASAVNKAKADKKRLEELKRLNDSVLKGRGLYIKPYKGKGIKSKKKKKSRRRTA